MSGVVTMEVVYMQREVVPRIRGRRAGNTSKSPELGVEDWRKDASSPRLSHDVP